MVGPWQRVGLSLRRCLVQFFVDPFFILNLFFIHLNCLNFIFSSFWKSHEKVRQYSKNSNSKHKVKITSTDENTQWKIFVGAGNRTRRYRFRVSYACLPTTKYQNCMKKWWILKKMPDQEFLKSILKPFLKMNRQKKYLHIKKTFENKLSSNFQPIISIPVETGSTNMAGVLVTNTPSSE